MTALLIASYLGAIVMANNIVTYFGPSGLLITGFFLIPFDLVSRDALHERWTKQKALKMALLIVGGSYLAFLTNPATKAVSVASAVSFLIAGGCDWLVYSAFENKSRLFRMNASNVASSLIDSLVFQMIAFGGLSISLAFSQTAIKIGGALLWTLLLVKLMNKIQLR